VALWTRLVSASPLIVGNNVEARVSTNMMRRRSGFAMTKEASDRLIALHSSECIDYLCIRLVQPCASFHNDMYYSQDVAGPSLRVVYRSCNVRKSETNQERASMQDGMVCCCDTTSLPLGTHPTPVHHFSVHHRKPLGRSIRVSRVIWLYKSHS
jgi:hypothetical protein